MNQLSFWSGKHEVRHGGGLGRGRRKGPRPIERRKPIHLVMRSKRARGEYSLKGLQREHQIEKLIYNKANRYGVAIATFANVGNHIHILLKFENRKLFRIWLKTITGQIARLVTKARKGRPFGRFWDELAFTRVIRSWVDAQHTRDYVIANAFESRYTKWVRDLFLWQAQHWREVRPKKQHAHATKNLIQLEMTS